jgi:Arc/MetJ-type ribon-helix-helix transcriptional regulator
MTKTILIRIDESLLQAVDVASAGDQRGRSEIVREALELWLKRRTLAEKVRRHREGYERHPVMADEFAPVLEAQVWAKSGRNLAVQLSSSR